VIKKVIKSFIQPAPGVYSLNHGKILEDSRSKVLRTLVAHLYSRNFNEISAHRVGRARKLRGQAKDGT
jgi:hypothetical protein